MTTEKGPKGSVKFECKTCDYRTSKQSQYDRHNLTAKHILLNIIMYFAGIAQLVERCLAKAKVAGSNPVSRSTNSNHYYKKIN